MDVTVEYQDSYDSVFLENSFFCGQDISALVNYTCQPAECLKSDRYFEPVITLHPEKQTSIYGSKVLTNLSSRIFVVLVNYYYFVS